MEKKKAMILGGVGIVSALGLGWLLTRLFSKNGGSGGGGNGGGDECGAGYHWDDALQSCVADDIPVPLDLDMSPAAIWARAQLLCIDMRDPEAADFEPPVSVMSYNFIPSYAPGPKTPVKNWFYWRQRVATDPSIIHMSAKAGYKDLVYRPGNIGDIICLKGTNNDYYVIYEWQGGETFTVQQLLDDESEQWKENAGQRQFLLNEGPFRWDEYGSDEPLGLWHMIEGFPVDVTNQDEKEREINSYEVGVSELVLMSEVDYLVPPDMMMIAASFADPRDAQMYNEGFGNWAPGPDFVVAEVPAGDPADISTWIYLRAGVPYALNNVVTRAYSRGPCRGTYFNGASVSSYTIPASGYQGGPVPGGSYEGQVVVDFPKMCIMKYNEAWYYPPTTEANPYPGDEYIDIPYQGDGQTSVPVITVYDMVASFSIGQAEVLSPTLEFWHWQPVICACYQAVVLYLPEGQSTTETQGKYKRQYTFTQEV